MDWQCPAAASAVATNIITLVPLCGTSHVYSEIAPQASAKLELSHLAVMNAFPFCDIGTIGLLGVHVPVLGD